MADAYKIVMAGNSGVGKTSIFMQFAKHAFNKFIAPTYGTKFDMCEIRVSSGKTKRSQVWDTAGQERFMSMTAQYFRDAECVIMVYSITDRNSFNDVKDCWMKYCRSNCPEAPIVLVANKRDLCIPDEVTEDEGRELALDIGAKAFILASALSGLGITLVFEAAVRCIEGDLRDLQEQSDEMRAFVLARKSPATRIYTTCCGDARTLRVSDEDRREFSELVSIR